MEYGLPEKHEPIRPDKLYPINFEWEGESKRYEFSPRWDRLDHFKDFGAWVLKIYDNEDGLVEIHTDEEGAKAVCDYTGITPNEREYMTQSEYDSWRSRQDGEG